MIPAYMSALVRKPRQGLCSNSENSGANIGKYSSNSQNRDLRNGISY
jgi:hypothetical protein